VIVRTLKIALLIALAVAVIYLLFTVVFPQVDAWLDDTAVEPRPEWEAGLRYGP
jgi:hypothetical protein